MSAFTGTPVNGPGYAAQITSARSDLVDMRLHVAQIEKYTHAAGVGTGEINLVKLPAGRIRVYSDLSRIVTTQFASAADLHIGHRAYVTPDGTAAGTTVVEDDNEWLDNADAGGGALDSALVLPAEGYTDYHSRDGIIVYAMVDSGNIENDDTIEGWIVYGFTN